MEQSSTQFGSSRQVYYQICVKGQLDRRWEPWFDGLRINIDQDTTVLSGILVDQAALFGVLLKIRDLGLPLLSVQPLSREEAGRHQPG